jgi:methylenetetrahydrofolate reductase (NADPH)
LNAPHSVNPAASTMAANSPASFLRQMSVEITPRQIDKIGLLAERLPARAKVFIALIDPADVANQIAAAKAVCAAGLVAVPHVPARFVRDVPGLDARLGAFAGEAGVTECLVLGGGAPTPVGIYDAAIQLLRTELFNKHGMTRIGVAGHPEGNPDITKAHGEPALMAALREKQAWIKDAGLQGFIATQFLFEAAPVAYWVSELRANGIDLPVHVGVPGPATIKTLVKYAAMCGVGNSARFVRKQALNITKLLTVNAPDEFIEQLSTLHSDRPKLGIAAPHLYPFGGFDKLFEWYSARTGT